MSFKLKPALLALSCFLYFFPVDKVFAETYSVPNSGSPYVNLGEVADDQIIHLPTGIPVTVDQMLDTISGSRVIYIGETHDNLEAHRVQLEIIRRLQEKFPGRVAVGMEMFRRSAQNDLDRWHEGTLSDKDFKKLFRKHWGPYKPYKPIFDYIKENRLPLLGLKSNRETQDRLRQKDKNTPDAQDVFPELDEKDIYHKPHTMSVFGGHGDTQGASGGAYQMLVLWEETMAETVADFLQNDRYRDWKLVVLSGGFHVQYGFGIPKRAFRRIPHAYSIILPTVTHIPEELKDRQMDVENVPIPLYAADFAWKLQYKVLPPNRIKLGVLLEELDQGLRVRDVGKKSNAARAGIQKDDVLIQLDKWEISSVEDFADRLQTKKFGDRVTLKLRRNGVDKDVEVILLEPPPRKPLKPAEP